MPQKVYPRSKDKETVYLKSVISNPNIIIGDYTMYNDFVRKPKDFEKNNVLYQYPINQDKLIIGKFCSIACGAKFIFNSCLLYTSRAALITHRKYLCTDNRLQDEYIRGILIIWQILPVQALTDEFGGAFMPMDPITIRSSSNSNLEINAIPGHFVTSHSHINYYIDITAMKHDFTMAREAAETLAGRFSYEKPVDTIICMDGTEVIGAFLAQALAKSSAYTVNSQKNIYVVPPEFSTNGQIIFRDNLEPMIAGHHVLLLLASVTTGKTIHRALECICLLYTSIAQPHFYDAYYEGDSRDTIEIDELKDKPLIIHQRYREMILGACRKRGFNPYIICENDEICLLYTSHGRQKLVACSGDRPGHDRRQTAERIRINAFRITAVSYTHLGTRVCLVKHLHEHQPGHEIHLVGLDRVSGRKVRVIRRGRDKADHRESGRLGAGFLLGFTLAHHHSALGAQLLQKLQQRLVAVDLSLIHI